ncbi:GIY-YIG nuclease family protein [Crenothrix sp.]|uniref:GIY-YIG nuclease family protein n=1 Tax=Crenothrix sp. TaxID=3100433 RepID=UPI00374DC9AA
MRNYTKNNNDNYDQLLGKAGVVYILANDALAPNIFKIGATQRSGALRAIELNKEATTGLPAEYKCIFEYSSLDCGRSERQVHEKLDKFRRGKHGFKNSGKKWGQEFFKIDDLELAKIIIIEICKNTLQAQPQERYSSSSSRDINLPYTNWWVKRLVECAIIAGGVLAIGSRYKEQKAIPIQAQTQSVQVQQTSFPILIEEEKKLAKVQTNATTNTKEGNFDSDKIQESLLNNDKQELSEEPVITQTNDTVRAEWKEESKNNNAYKIAEIKGNRDTIRKQMNESKRFSLNSNYYRKLSNNAKTETKCEFKTVMTNEEIKNCQN